MKTISLTEAYKMFNNIKLPSAYNSVSQNRLREDEELLNVKLDILLKIKTAEKTAGINEVKDLLEVNKLNVDYWNTANSNLYYKENIAKTDREYIKRQFVIAKSEKEYLNNLLQLNLDNIRIEL